MPKQSDWSKSMTTQIKSNMEESARAAYLNGCELHEDAFLLFEAKRFPRSAALSILSEEEFSKAFILLICADQGRWDSNIYKSLRKHPEKQGIAEAMRDHFDWFSRNYSRIMEMNRFSFVQHQPSTIPDEAKMYEIVAKAKSRFSRPIRDYLKQDAFYVSLNEEAKLKSIPASISKEEAQSCLEESAKFKAITEVLLGNPVGAVKRAEL